MDTGPPLPLSWAGFVPVQHPYVGVSVCRGYPDDVPLSQAFLTCAVGRAAGVGARALPSPFSLRVFIEPLVPCASRLPGSALPKRFEPLVFFDALQSRAAADAPPPV